MNKILILAVFAAIFTVVVSVKEWKNFENGKVYSHKTSTDKKQTKSHGAHRAPVVEERLLHSHHRDKKMHHQQKPNELDAEETKEHRGKNAERHHKKNIEEEMHLRPLNERHHKFPNPAILNKLEDANSPSPQISRHKLLKQETNKHPY